MCSRVCGITPSSAATTRMHPSIPVAPATIVLTKFSWPGTSTMPTSMSAITHGAKPSSIDMPRSFSILSRSVSQPVRSLTNAVLPWSICPAVPSVTLCCWMLFMSPTRRGMGILPMSGLGLPNANFGVGDPFQTRSIAFGVPVAGPSWPCVPSLSLPTGGTPVGLTGRMPVPLNMPEPRPPPRSRSHHRRPATCGGRSGLDRSESAQRPAAHRAAVAWPTHLR